MYTKTILSILGGAAICVTPLCAQTGAVSKRDAEFLKVAAEADMTTTHIGKMAEDRAAANEVKDFGKKLAQDHTSDYKKLCEFAAKTGETVPRAIDKRDDREIAALDKSKGKAFDRAFLAHEAVAHEKLIKAFKQEAEHGDNPDIKAYANKALPVIEGHLHDVQDLRKPTTHKG
jgi:putative membrane protein